MSSKQSASVSNGSPHVQNVQHVNATSGGLVKATLGAALAAGAILTLVWLPAEYGIDPTGVGTALGLTEMGKVKAQLQAEADADAAHMTQGESSGLDASKISMKLDSMQAQLSALSTAVHAKLKSDDKQSVAPPATPPAPAPETDVATASWRDEVEYTLAPGEGIEVKLVMDEGAAIEYEWSANGAVVNHDTHGDGNRKSISYEQGRSVPEKAGQLIAAFTGNHGWFWRNRTGDPVVVTLRTRGAYKEMVLPEK